MSNKEPISTLGMSEADWLEHRRSGIGGSDVAAILGLTKWRTPLQVWEDKKGISPPQEDNEAMLMGRMLEPIVAERWTQATGRVVQKDNKIRFHKDHDILLANIDRLIVSNDDGNGPGILEIKTTSSWAFKEWQEQIPLHYYCQLMHYLNVTGYTWGEFGILVDGRNFERMHIERDPEFIAKMEQELLDWWFKYMTNNQKPPMKDKEADFAKSLAGSSIEASGPIVSVCNDLKVVKEQAKQIKYKQEELEAQIKEFMQDTENLIAGDMMLATYKTQIQSRFNSKRFSKENPDLYEQYKEDQEQRRFTLKLK